MVAFRTFLNLAFPAVLSLAGLSIAQDVASACTLPDISKEPAPSLAPGLTSRVITANLTEPRGIVFDSAGHLLVIDRTVGIKVLTLKDNGGDCVVVSDIKLLVKDTSLNHGIEIVGGYLLASNPDTAYAWKYDAQGAKLTGERRALITGMANPDHNTRTITKSLKKPGTIMLNRGSDSNNDPLALNVSTGHAQVKAFDILALGESGKPYDWTRDGKLLGWGLRNSEGIAEHPQTGGIWTTEESYDNIERAGVTFNDNNPGEELNYLGTLVNNKSPNQGANFGYPSCFAAWDVAMVPKPPKNLQVGQQFSIARPKVTDAECKNQRVAPRLTFIAHMTPLSITFHPDGNTAYVAFHGSFDRPDPQGYKVAKIAFKNGEPVDPSTSQTAAETIVVSKNPSICPTGCYHPVAFALGTENRVFFSSDMSGEIIVVHRQNGGVV